MKVQIILEKNETREEAEELLLKALDAKKNGDYHSEDVFLDPAMEDTTKFLLASYAEILEDMFLELEMEMERR